MHDGFLTLSEREKETLRLLLIGHDAKSIARQLGLSVHTINERLRDARRKLGVSSSREAARILASHENADPDIRADKNFGDAGPDLTVPMQRQPDRRRWPARTLAWATGGMFVMLVIIAAATLTFGNLMQSGVSSDASKRGAAGGLVIRPASDGTETTARRWLALVDRNRWDESWNAADSLIRQQVPRERWASILQPARGPLGPVSSRTLVNSGRTKSLPGAPPGDYSVLQFRTRFAQNPEGVETVTLARDGSSWKVAGYFIR